MMEVVQTHIIPERGCVDDDVMTAMASLGCFKDRDKLVNELLSPVHNTGWSLFTCDFTGGNNDTDLSFFTF